jgi:hypothetical protein
MEIQVASDSSGTESGGSAFKVLKMSLMLLSYAFILWKIKELRGF